MEAQTETKQSGVVKWFNNAKGWGFISQVEDGKDIFVHYSQIHGDGYRTLRQGQQVVFVLRDGPRGKWAEEVVEGQPVPDRLEELPAQREAS